MGSLTNSAQEVAVSAADRASPSIVPHEAGDRRDALFHETAAERLERWALGTAWALKPKRIGALPALARVWLADLVSPKGSLPDARSAPNAHDGLCGIVHDTS